jgi:hypothetical protein
MMTPDEIEKKARAEYEAQTIPRGHYLPAWDQAADIIRDAWRRFVRGVGPHPKHLP